MADATTNNAKKDSPIGSGPQRRENPLVNILFNIILPIIVLEQLTKRLGENGPLIALVVALAFPVGCGIWDYVSRRHKNAISLLGIVNILMTGGLALFQLEGIWFAVKEAAFPLIIGIAVWISAYAKRNFMQLMTWNENFMNVTKVEEQIEKKGVASEVKLLLKRATVWFAMSFFLSAFLNYFLARWIFVDIDTGLSQSAHAAALNDQIAKMTWLSYLVIALPLMVFSMLIMWRFFSRLKRLTGLDLTEILPQTEVK